MKKVKSAYDDMEFGIEYNSRDFEIAEEKIYYDRKLCLLNDTKSQAIRSEEYRSELIRSSKRLTNLIDIVKPGTQYRIITEGYVFPHSIVPYLITQRDVIDTLNITVVFIGYDVAKLLYDCVRLGGIKQMNIILSTIKMYQEDTPQWLKEFYSFCTNHEKINLGIANIHAKVIACNIGDDYYVLEGSCNTSTVQSLIEQMVLDNSKQVFDFHSKWFEYVISKYKSNARNYRNDFVGRW